jgi:ADP-ribose pyrophosphatase YjhB (NUDIX family)
MVAASILPISIHQGKIYFLFGKENEMEDSSKGFSDFGGAVESGESIIDTALREGSEELCGFLGEPKQIKQLIKTNGGLYKVSHNGYHVHLFYMDYDEKLPHYFTNHHRFLWNRMNKKMLNNSKYFEKQEIKWFSVEEMRTSQEKFRHFYIEIVNKLLDHLKKITDFANKMKATRSRHSRSPSLKTRKHRGG